MIRLLLFLKISRIMMLGGLLERRCLERFKNFRNKMFKMVKQELRREGRGPPDRGILHLKHKKIYKKKYQKFYKMPGLS